MTKVSKFVAALSKVISKPFTIEVKDCLIADSCIAFERQLPITSKLLIELDEINPKILVSSIDFGNGKVTVLSMLDGTDPDHIWDAFNSQYK